MRRSSAAAAVLLFIFSSCLYSQSALTGDEGAAGEIPPGYGEIALGMNIDEVKRLLETDPVFIYRGEPDVSMTPVDNRQVIDCEGSYFVERGYFQFDEDLLYLITMVLDPQRIDHYSIYSGLTEKYGEPSYLDPSKAVWSNEQTSLSLERPLSIKYIDRAVFEKLQNESYAEETVEEMLRQDFINTF